MAGTTATGFLFFLFFVSVINRYLLPLCGQKTLLLTAGCWAIAISVTGQDSAEDRTRSFEAGADEFFVKPVSLKTLDRGIAKYFPDYAHNSAPS
jgi:hypothetical protein